MCSSALHGPRLASTPPAVLFMCACTAASVAASSAAVRGGSRLREGCASACASAAGLAVAVGMEDDASGRGGASGGGWGLSEDDGAVHGCGACLFADL